MQQKLNNKEMQKLIADFVGLVEPACESDEDVKGAFWTHTWRDDLLGQNTAYRIAESWETLSDEAQCKEFDIAAISPSQFLKALQAIGIDAFLKDGANESEIVDMLLELYPELEAYDDDVTELSDDQIELLKSLEPRFIVTPTGVKMVVGGAPDYWKQLGNREPSQDRPKGFYIYSHRDQEGNIFYIGKGKGRRAWSTDRHYYWNRYVENHLLGKYEVKILVDSLAENEAEEVEWEEIRQRSDTLVNWMRPTADLDFQDNERYEELRKT